MSKNKSKNQTKVRPYAVMCTDLYLLWILMVYPLYYADGYFHLPEKKATFWCVSTLIYLGVTLFGIVITTFSSKEQWDLERIKKDISITDIFMFGFLISNLIAFALSQDKVRAWTGAGSRYYGAKVLILACLVYFVVSRCAWVNKVFLWAFLLGGNVVCLLATFDYFGMDVLGINKQMQPSDWLIFISTLGNANTCASYIAMVVAGAMAYFLIAGELSSKILCGITIVNSSIAMITSRSDSVFIGMAVAFVVIIVLAVKEKVLWKDVVLAVMLMDIGFLSLSLLRKNNIQHLLDETNDSGIPRMVFSNSGILALILVVTIVLYAIIYYMERKSIVLSKKYICGIYAGSLICGTVIVGILVKKLQLFELFVSGIGLDADFNVGTRIYTYRITLESFANLPFINKVFGSGQSSLTDVLNTLFGTELYRWGMSINSTHDSILEYLMMCGIFGAVCYVGAVITTIIAGIRKAHWDKNILVVIIIVISYFAQGLFNIEQTNTTTIFWLFIALAQAMCRQSVINKR